MGQGILSSAKSSFSAALLVNESLYTVREGLGVETERVPGVETERAMSGPLLRQGVETERECAKNVTGVALWRGSKPNARGSKPNAGSISCGRRRIVALSLAKKWFDII